ncbi:hypothetical protein JRO89_XS08G0082100 [Xanthoceras sorbifolium]|uniref:U-box domain-containing protein n=1 Tax=Xanthoceras sorbifolium TaxID=99658 RepID=A0ABQ8HP11_9ROSI|nr:hypothetical protein JRO89_XS08G0082100 [Xanthoceras sorbifolium]
MTIPHLFRCPISLDLFTDPVTLSTGQTYDRSSIDKWLSAGNLTCPVTMQNLHDPTLVPNHTLRHLINQWLQLDDHHFDSDYFTTIHSIPALKLTLESPQLTTQNKLQTLENILNLSKQSPSTTSCLVQLGFLPLILDQLFGKVESEFSQDFVQFVEKALSCVLSLLPLGQMECLNMLKEVSNMESLLLLFEHGNSMVINKSLCHLVEAISSSLETKELCSMLGKNHRLLHRIVSLLQHNNNSEASNPAIKALSALCSSESNRENLVREGAISGLITYISNAVRCDEKSLAAIAMTSIEQLLEVASAKEALINHPNGVYVVVKMVFRVSDHEGSESAINSLMIICCDSLQVREEAICCGVLTQLLLLLQSQCSNRTKTKARMLLKLLRSKWAEEQNHYNV